MYVNVCNVKAGETCGARGVLLLFAGNFTVIASRLTFITLNQTRPESLFRRMILFLLLLTHRGLMHRARCITY